MAGGAVAVAGAAAGAVFNVVTGGVAAGARVEVVGAGLGFAGAVVSVWVPGAGALSRDEAAPPVRQMPSVRLTSFEAAAGEIALSAVASGSVRIEPTIISLMPPGPKAVGLARKMPTIACGSVTPVVADHPREIDINVSLRRTSRTAC